MASSKDYHIAAESDISGKVNRHILYYFALLAVLLFVTIAGLHIMYLFQLDYEKERKIGKVQTREVLDQMALSESYLFGKKGLFENKKHVAVDVAMDRLISSFHKGR